MASAGVAACLTPARASISARAADSADRFHTVTSCSCSASTLARVLAEHEHDVTVWNRSALSAARAEMLARAGVRQAATPAEAIAALYKRIVPRPAGV